MSELDDYAKAEKAEWGTWTATTDIVFGNALAYRAGDPVPASNVATYGYDKQGLVQKTAAEKTPTTSSSTSAKG